MEAARGVEGASRPREEVDPVEAQRRLSDSARKRASYRWLNWGHLVPPSLLRREASCNRSSAGRTEDEEESSRAAAWRHAPLPIEIYTGSGYATPDQELEEYSLDSSLATWEASSDEDDPISDIDYAMPEQEQTAMEELMRRSRRSARRTEKCARSTARLEELLLQEGYRADALHHGMSVPPGVVVVSDGDSDD